MDQVKVEDATLDFGKLLGFETLDLPETASAEAAVADLLNKRGEGPPA